MLKAGWIHYTWKIFQGVIIQLRISELEVGQAIHHTMQAVSSSSSSSSNNNNSNNDDDDNNRKSFFFLYKFNLDRNR